MNPFDEVRQAFGRAARHYDAVADYQQEAGRRLLAGQPWPALGGRCLDLGCGTGHGVALLAEAFPDLTVTAVDFALPMLAQLAAVFSPPPSRICADVHALPLQANSFDLCWSSLTLQWCDPGRSFNQIARILKPGGRLALSTLGPGTFAELRQTFAAVDTHRHTLDFVDEQLLHDALACSGLRLVHRERRAIISYRPELRSLLAQVRELGANRVLGGNRRQGLMGKAAWQRLLHAYEALRTEQGLPLTYDTLFLYAEK